MSEWHKKNCSCVICEKTWIGMVMDGCGTQLNNMLECPYCGAICGFVESKISYHWRMFSRNLPEIRFHFADYSISKTLWFSTSYAKTRYSLWWGRFGISFWNLYSWRKFMKENNI